MDEDINILVFSLDDILGLLDYYDHKRSETECVMKQKFIEAAKFRDLRNELKVKFPVIEEFEKLKDELE